VVVVAGSASLSKAPQCRWTCPSPATCPSPMQGCAIRRDRTFASEEACHGRCCVYLDEKQKHPPGLISLTRACVGCCCWPAGTTTGRFVRTSRVPSAWARSEHEMARTEEAQDQIDWSERGLQMVLALISLAGTVCRSHPAAKRTPQRQSAARHGRPRTGPSDCTRCPQHDVRRTGVRNSWY